MPSGASKFFSTRLGVILKSKSQQPKKPTKIQENIALNRPQKGLLLTEQELKQEGKKGLLIQLHPRNGCKDSVFAALRMSTDDPKAPG